MTSKADKAVSKVAATIIAVVIVVAAAGGAFWLQPTSESTTITVTQTEETEKVVTKTQVQTQTQEKIVTTTASAPKGARQGGVVNVGVNRQTGTLDPLHVVNSQFSDTIGMAVFEALVVIDLNNQPAPWLAESWNKVDETTWIFKLRKGVNFHDGTPFTAWSVKESIQRGLDDTTAIKSNAFLIESVNVIDDHTVQLNLLKDGPYTEVLYWLSMSQFGFIVSPAAVEKYGDDFGRNLVGTGPFKFVEWVEESHVTLVANDDYWMGRPNLDGITVRVIPEESVRVIMLEKGELQLTEVSPSQANRLESNDSLNVVEGSLYKTLMISLNLQYAFDNTQGNQALQSKLVRQAINYAIDREELVVALEQGRAVPANTLLMPANALWDANIGKYPATADIAKAKSLLAEAGYPDGIDLEIMTSGSFVKSLEIGTVLQQQLAAAGIRVEIKNVEFAELVERAFKTREYDAMIHDFGWRPPHAYFARYYHSDYIGSGKPNIANIDDPRMDALVDKIQPINVADVAAMRQYTDEIQKIALEEGYGVYMYYIPRISASTADLQGGAVEHPFPRYTWGFILSLKPIGVDAFLTQ